MVLRPYPSTQNYNISLPRPYPKRIFLSYTHTHWANIYIYIYPYLRIYQKQYTRTTLVPTWVLVHPGHCQTIHMYVPTDISVIFWVNFHQILT
jgi:hypothetical protein